MSVDQQISSCMLLDNTQKEELAKSFKEEYSITDSPLLPSTIEQDKKEQQANFFSSVPALFQWNLFHGALTEFASDNLDEKLARGIYSWRISVMLVPKDWLQALSKRDALFFMFLREWVLYIRSVVAENLLTQIPWLSIPGYSNFVLAFLYEFKKAEQISKPLMDASLALLLTEPSIVNFYVKFTFLKTNVYSVTAVGGTSTNLHLNYQNV